MCNSYTTPKDMLPFNLQEAVADPSRIRTREGREVIWITYIPFEINQKVKRTYPVTAYVADYGPAGTGSPETYGYWLVNYTYDGKYYKPKENEDGQPEHEESEFDLFLLSE